MLKTNYLVRERCHAQSKSNSGSYFVATDFKGIFIPSAKNRRSLWPGSTYFSVYKDYNEHNFFANLNADDINRLNTDAVTRLFFLEYIHLPRLQYGLTSSFYNVVFAYQVAGTGKLMFVLNDIETAQRGIDDAIFSSNTKSSLVVAGQMAIAFPISLFMHKYFTKDMLLKRFELPNVESMKDFALRNAM